MIEYEQILKVKEDAEARLRTIPGVHAVGISKKVVQGKSTGELCIVVFLVRKKPLDQLAPEEVVPTEIDGVKTDVVEMEVPRSMAIPIPSLVATVAPDQQSVTFSGTANQGSPVIMLLITYGLIGGKDFPRLFHFELTASMMLSVIAKSVAAGLANSGAFTAMASGTTVMLKTTINMRAAITRCIATTADADRYVEEYIRGGIQIARGTSAGTLGCLATTTPTAKDPHGKVVAITCHHVVGLTEREDNKNLTAATPEASPSNEITFIGIDPIPLNTLIVVRIELDEFSTIDEVVSYSTIAGNTALEVAESIASAINKLEVIALSAYAAGSVVTVFGGTPQCSIYGPPKVDASTLQATVVGLDIDFRGEVSGDDYGIFTNINTGGSLMSGPHTFGTYTHPAKGSTLSTIAQDVAQSINDLPVIPVRGVITAVASGARVTVSDAQEVECTIKTDCRVGQPSASFGSACSPCSNHGIGHVLDARIDVDIALIQLDAGQKYKAEIEGVVGRLTGTYDLKPEDVKQLEVSKRGRTSRLTHGVVDAVNISGEFVGPNRLYNNAASITPKPDEVYFSLPGDSGSAVLKKDPATGDFSVVGILFGKSSGISMITPIGQILAAFPSLALNVAPAPEAGHAMNEVRVVPAPAMATVAPAGQAVTSSAPFLGQRLAQAEREMTATSAGSEVAEIVKRHFAETQHLVNSNRRVATVWHRNGGPRILEAVLGLLQRRDNRLPEEIDGKPFADCLERIKSVITRYASPALAADLARFSPLLRGFSGFAYAEVLSALQAGGPE